MKKVLLIAATSGELAHFDCDAFPWVEVMICGPSSVMLTYQLTERLQQQKFDAVILAGIGGSYDRQLMLGDVVAIQNDRFADIGAEDADGSFIDFFEGPLLDKHAFPFTDGKLFNPYLTSFLPTGIQMVSALTVNTTTGTAATITQRKRLDAQLESMEGAAFHYVCLHKKIPFLQLRAVSNYVEPRNKNAWQVEQAIEKLAEVLTRVLTNFQP